MSERYFNTADIYREEGRLPLGILKRGSLVRVTTYNSTYVICVEEPVGSGTNNYLKGKISGGLLEKRGLGEVEDAWIYGSFYDGKPPDIRNNELVKGMSLEFSIPDNKGLENESGRKRMLTSVITDFDYERVPSEESITPENIINNGNST